MERRRIGAQISPFPPRPPGPDPKRRPAFAQERREAWAILPSDPARSQARLRQRGVV